MPIITIKHNGTVYQRKIERNPKGIYIMYSKGVQYWFMKDAKVKTNNGWHLINGTNLPDFMMELISNEMECINIELNDAG
ncbi:MAG TPA: hypothetical protein VGB63_15320 [Pedobacter sp.]|jgi:hypothetical protein